MAPFIHTNSHDQDLILTPNQDGVTAQKKKNSSIFNFSWFKCKLFYKTRNKVKVFLYSLHTFFRLVAYYCFWGHYNSPKGWRAALELLFAFWWVSHWKMYYISCTLITSDFYSFFSIIVFVLNEIFGLQLIPRKAQPSIIIIIPIPTPHFTWIFHFLTTPNRNTKRGWKTCPKQGKREREDIEKSLSRIMAMTVCHHHQDNSYSANHHHQHKKRLVHKRSPARLPAKIRAICKPDILYLFI